SKLPSQLLDRSTRGSVARQQSLREPGHLSRKQLGRLHHSLARPPRPAPVAHTVLDREPPTRRAEQPQPHATRTRPQAGRDRKLNQHIIESTRKLLERLLDQLRTERPLQTGHHQLRPQGTLPLERRHRRQARQTREAGGGRIAKNYVDSLGACVPG